ncbi:MAG: class I SAM-dependent methyltransferase [Acidimicrobiales bacterium]
MTLELPGWRLELATDAGVFSARRIDPGTRLLLSAAPGPPASGEVMDLGCGYGPIAVALAVKSPGCRVWAVDVNPRALRLTRDNAARLGLGNVVVARPEEVPEGLRLSTLYSNPPARIGKPALHLLLETWLSRLLPGTSAYIVMQRNLGSGSLGRWLDGEGFAVERVRSAKGYRVLGVTGPRPGAG